MTEVFGLEKSKEVNENMIKKIYKFKKKHFGKNLIAGLKDLI